MNHRRIIKKVLQFGVILAIVEIPLWLQHYSRKGYISSLATAGRQNIATVSATSTAALGDAQPLEWRILKEMNSTSKQPAASIMKLESRLVRIVGFMVPLADGTPNASEFLLVPSPLSCIHAPTPPNNQIIFGQASGEKTFPIVIGAVEVTGIFHISSIGTSTSSSPSYQLEVQSVEKVKE